METPFERYGDTISEQDRMLLSVVRDYVEKEIMPVRQQLDEDKDRTLVHRIKEGLVKLGFQRAYLPAEIGGMEIRSMVTFCPIMEEIARGDLGTLLELLIGGGWVWIPAIRSENKVVWEKLMAPFVRDEVHSGCVALTEPHGGCNIESGDAQGRAIRTIARLDGDEWVINGSKRWPSGAGASDVYLTVCTTDPSLGTDGVALIYVPEGTPGLSFGKPENKMGLVYTDVNADIYYENVRVPRQYRAGTPGEDYLSMKAVISWGRLGVAAAATGTAQAVLEIAIDYTGSRYYAGKRVREHSLQAAMLADMAIGVESARAYYLHVAQMFDHPDVYGDNSSDRMLARCTGAKIHNNEVALMVCNKAIELMGSYGYAKEFNVEKYLRDTKINQLWLGGAQLGRIDVARGYYPTLPYERVEPFA